MSVAKKQLGEQGLGGNNGTRVIAIEKLQTRQCDT